MHGSNPEEGENLHYKNNVTKLQLFIKRIFPTGFKHESKHFFRHVPGLVMCQISQWYVQPIAVIFGGHLGRIELDAIGLACSIINVFTYAIIWGASAACDVAFSHTYGGQNKKMIGVYLQRCLIVLMLTLLPCYALHINIEGLLILVGQDPQVSRLCGRYILIFIPGSMCMFLYVILNKYCICQNIVNHDIWMGLVAHGFHAGLQYLFLYQLNMGIDGSALAQVCFYAISVIMRLVLLACSKNVKESWGGWSIQCFGGWGPLFRLAFAGGVMMCAEWWAYEVSSIMAGLLGIAELGAQTVIFNILTTINAFGIAFATAGMIRMGHHLGAGQPAAAVTAGRVVFMFTIVNGLWWITLLLLLKDEIGKIFTREQDVVDIVSSAMPFVATYTICESVTVMGRFAYRVATKQKIGAVIVFVTFYLLAMPIGYSLMFLTDLRINGLWLGFTVSTAAMAISMTIGWNLLFDWDKISEEAQERAHILPEETTADIEKERSFMKGGYPVGSGHYGSMNTKVNQIRYESKEDIIASWKTSTGSYITEVFKGEEQTVTRSEIIRCCFIISAFFLILIGGVIVRLSTQDLIDGYHSKARSNGTILQPI